jgi:hypothetical protein
MAESFLAALSTPLAQCHTACMEARKGWSGAVCVVALAAVGCAGTFAPVDQQPDFGQYFTMSVLGGTEQAKLEGPRLHGADLEVSRFEGGYRGMGRSGVIDLRTEGKKITGNVGAGSTELYVDDGPDGLHIRGRFAERMSDLAVQPDRLAGTMGRCHYDLRRPGGQGPWYEGQRVCGGANTGVRLALPSALAALSALDRGVLLAVFLASEEVRKPIRSLGDPGGDPRVPHRQPGDMGTQAPPR